MRNYEIVILFSSTNKIQYEKTLEKYLQNIKEKNGIIYRLEHWGIRELAYKINNFNKAYYVLLNIKCNIILIKELKSIFNMNNIILRSLIIKKKEPVIESSIIIKNML